MRVNDTATSARVHIDAALVCVMDDDSDDDSLAAASCDLTKWIGQGRIYENVPADIIAARRDVLRIPSAVEALIPATNTSISALLILDLPPKTHCNILDTEEDEESARKPFSFGNLRSEAKFGQNLSRDLIRGRIRTKFGGGTKQKVRTNFSKRPKSVFVLFDLKRDNRRSYHHEQNPVVVPAPVQKQRALPGREAHLILDEPYGGPTLHVGDYARVLLFAGGSGATFTLGVLDDLMGCATLPLGVGGEEVRTTQVIATHAALPGWPIKLSTSIYVMCLCDPDAVLAIPGVPRHRGAAARGRHARGLLGGSAADDDDEDGGKRKSEASSANASVEASPAKVAPVADAEKGDWLGEDAHGGGVVEIAAGPDGLIRETGNAVVRPPRGGVLFGGVYCLGSGRGG
ncbi:hypothetical protein B0H17DRAFT_1176047 [Mycena rosella]|uniref:Uncharacterized protein n=1 Tax=Mycena rosella TaxID=1033263 RepID=A0AAD7GQ70_MYCRO|nr:hypothetical protein B0H17DRAFT_1176047 [Mycena rosella]